MVGNFIKHGGWCVVGWMDGGWMVVGGQDKEVKRQEEASLVQHTQYKFN